VGEDKIGRRRRSLIPGPEHQQGQFLGDGFDSASEVREGLERTPALVGGVEEKDRGAQLGRRLEKLRLALRRDHQSGP